MKPQLNHISPPVVRLFAPDDAFLGQVNEYEMNDFRVQIQRDKAVGYYVIDPDGVRHNLDRDGRYETYPECLDLMTRQLSQLI